MTVSPNSIFVYNDEIKGKKENSQDALLLIAFVAFGRPATARMIQKYLREVMDKELEVNVMSRSFNNLHSGKKKPAKIIKVADDKCEVTGRQAAYYEPIIKLT
jgi:hypothetical protein